MRKGLLIFALLLVVALISWAAYAVDHLGNLTGTSDGTNSYPFSAPRAVVVDSSGNIHVADTGNYRVQVCDIKGELVRKWGTQGYENSQFQMPLGIGLGKGSDGVSYVYVLDHNIPPRVSKFNSTGGYITSWGSYGTSDSQFWEPHGLAVDQFGNVYVADTQNNRIQVFSGNSSPVLTAIGNKSVQEGATLTFTINATDPDSDAPTYSAGNLPAGATFNAATRTFTWTPTAEQAGIPYEVTFAVSDGELSDSETVAINVNQLPLGDAGGDRSVYEGNVVTLTGFGSDPEGGAVSYRWNQVGETATAFPVILDDPAAAEPTFTAPWVGSASVTLVFQLTVTDSGGATATDECNVVVKPKTISDSAYNYPVTGYRASFSVNVSYASTPSGSLTYYYLKTRMNLVSTGITNVTVSGKTATITGTGTVNGTTGYTFTATVIDGSPDQFGITITKSNGSLYYSAATSAISGGNLVVP